MFNLSSVSSSPLPLPQEAPLLHRRLLLLLLRLSPSWVLYLHNSSNISEQTTNWYSSSCHNVPTKYSVCLSVKYETDQTILQESKL